MTLLAVLGSAAAICACSVVVGAAIWRLAGFAEWSWLSGPVGLATLLALLLAAVSLPGAGVTGAVALVAITVVALVIVVRGRTASRRDVGETAAALALGLAVAALPFIATGQLGILGVTDNADLSAHLMLTEAVRTGHTPIGLDPNWYSTYPTGPHSLIASLNALTGVRFDAAFNGLLLATVALTVMSTLALLREVGQTRRLIGAAIAGVPYLGAAYVVQSAFKEPLLGLFVVGWTLALRPVVEALPGRQRSILPLALLAAGAYADYSFVALAWLGAIAAAWAVLAVVRARRLPRLRLSRRWAVAPILAIVLLAAAVVPQLDQAQKLKGAVEITAGGHTTGGNIRAELPSYEVFGTWPASDLRAFQSRLRAFAVLGGIVALWAAWWWWRRGRTELPGAAAAVLVVYGGARATATPYYSAKALAIASFVIGVMSVCAVILALPPLARLRELRPSRVAAAVAGIAFLAVAAWSSGLALRGARVAPPEHDRELASLRPLLIGQPTLYMGQNDYVPWLLRDVKVAFPYIFIGQSQVPFAVRPETGWKVTQPFDFDKVVPQYLDRFRFALSPRTAFASQPPPNWHLVRTTPSYELWERRGPTAPRAVLPEHGAPGASFQCNTPLEAPLARANGQAAVRPAPVVIGSSALRHPAGHELTKGQFRFRTLAPGDDAQVTVPLPPGRYDVSLQYQSPVALQVSAGPARLALPASMEGPGAFWSAGTFTTAGGPTTIRLHPQSPPALATFRVVALGSLALTPVGGGDSTVPMQRACGRYVDWYRTA